MNLMGTDVVTQIGLVVNDVRKTGKKYAEFFGVDVPEVVNSGDPAIVKGTFNGEPTDASCEMMFFNMANIQIELIQPDHKPSAWRAILDEKGEGLHHIAFKVKSGEETIKAMEERGIPLMHQGNYGNASGQFIYMDAREDLKMIVELLEDF